MSLRVQLAERCWPRTRVLTLSLVLLLACGSLRNEQLASVAKDWSYVIRASQVMPVYPLTEDLFPGDIFLVQLPIEEQQQAWKDKGYLPLDNHLGRVTPPGYKEFYENSFLLADAGTPPKLWLTATASSPAWSAAPQAAFPTYSFEAKEGLGLSAALPIQGVPVGLSLLGAKSAAGTATIADARTYGTDIASLAPAIDDWAVRERVLLAHFAPREGRRNFIRVVSRVYLAGRVSVSIENTESAGGGLRAGASPPVDLLVPDRGDGANAGSVSTSGEVADGGVPAPRAGAAAQPLPDGKGTPGALAYVANIKSLNETLQALYADAKGGAGLTFKVTSFSTRSVSLSETFPRPLVIGYLGFDFPIGDNGSLGPPIPTYAVVAYGRTPETNVGTRAALLSSARMQLVAATLTEMARGGDARAKDLAQKLDEAGAVLPPLYPCNIYDSGGQVTHAAGEPLRTTPPRYDRVSVFRGGLLQTIANLERGLKNPSFQLGDQPQTVGREEAIQGRLAMTRAELERLETDLLPFAPRFVDADHYTAPYEGR